MHRLLGRVLGERDQEADCWFETVEEALGAVEPLLFPEEQALSSALKELGSPDRSRHLGISESCLRNWMALTC